jgi:hypothetical protein
LTYSGGILCYRRDLDHSRNITITPMLGDSGLMHVQFALNPPIGGHTREEHKNAGQAASILFKVAMVLGERGGGTIKQMSLMGACKSEGEELILAQYPDSPLMYENLCAGFRADMLNGNEQLA